jgi:hypothetical protein
MLESVPTDAAQLHPIGDSAADTMHRNFELLAAVMFDHGASFTWNGPARVLAASECHRGPVVASERQRTESGCSIRSRFQI